MHNILRRRACHYICRQPGIALAGITQAQAGAMRPRCRHRIRIAVILTQPHSAGSTYYSGRAAHSAPFQISRSAQHFNTLTFHRRTAARDRHASTTAGGRQQHRPGRARGNGHRAATGRSAVRAGSPGLASSTRQFTIGPSPGRMRRPPGRRATGAGRRHHQVHRRRRLPASAVHQPPSALVGHRHRVYRFTSFSPATPPSPPGFGPAVRPATTAPRHHLPPGRHNQSAMLNAHGSANRGPHNASASSSAAGPPRRRRPAANRPRRPLRSASLPRHSSARDRPSASIAASAIPHIAPFNRLHNRLSSPLARHSISLHLPICVSLQCWQYK